eukprot:scaffold10433_cov133-Isochrysis_galbana.AAC.2
MKRRPGQGPSVRWPAAQTGSHATIGQAHWQASSYRATIYYTHTTHGTHTHDMHDIQIAFCVEKNHNDSNMIPGYSEKPSLDLENEAPLKALRDRPLQES